MGNIEPYVDDRGRVWVPKRAEAETEDVVGIGWVELTEEDPDYAQWMAYLGELNGPDWARKASDTIAR